MADREKAHPVAALPANTVFRYPSEEEYIVRRLGSALLANWNAVPEELREKILADAASAWDREYNVRQIAQKLEAFVRRHPGRLTPAARYQSQTVSQEGQ